MRTSSLPPCRLHAGSPPTPCPGRSSSSSPETSAEYGHHDGQRVEENDVAHQIARGLLEKTELEPSPPPGGETPKGTEGAPDVSSFGVQIDGDSALSDMITPRPGGEQDATHDDDIGVT